MKDRIKMVRKTAGLSQVEFGSRIGLTQPAIAGYESGARTPLDTVITSICREFVVNEEWLRTGSGEPYFEKTEDEAVAQFLGEVLSGMPDTDRKKRFISAIARMDETFWDQVAKFEEALLEEQRGTTKKDE